MEKVYENALTHRLRKVGMEVKQQYPLNVYDEDGTLLGEYCADLLIEDALLVEMKAAKSLALEHEAQILGYLRCARLEHGLLMNFGSPNSKFASSRGRGTNDNPEFLDKCFCVLCVLCG